MQHPASTPATGRDHPARLTPHRRRRRRHRHDQQRITPVDVLDMDTVEPEQHVAAGTRISSRAHVSAPRSRVKHVEVLGQNQRVSTTDPRGPRPLPADHHTASLTPPDVRRATYAQEPPILVTAADATNGTVSF